MTQSHIKKLVLIILAIAIILIAAAIFYSNNHPHKHKPVFINTQGQPTMGYRNASVHIVVFEDLKCHNCARFDREIFPKLKKQYIDTRKAKYTVINLAFIPGSMPVANAARCLYKQNKAFFFRFVHTIYQHQPSESKNWATIPRLLQFANRIPGVDQKKLSQCLIESPYVDFIQDNLKLASQIMGGQVATPTVYVNGRLVKPLTMKRLKALIDAAQSD